MKKNLNNTILLILAIALAFASFMFFRVLLSGNTSSYTSEISAAFLGSILTIIITAIMLNKQSDVDMRKDRSSMMLEKKINLYDGLMKQLGDILIKGGVSKDDVVAVQILNQRMAFIADEDVVKSFSAFASKFADAAKDGTLNDSEKDELLDAVGNMSVKMRFDILSREEKVDFEEETFKTLVKANTEFLKTKKITRDGFLERCSDDEKSYFKYLVDSLDNKDITFDMGTKGISIKDNNGTPIVWCFPSTAKRNIEILKDKLSNESATTVVRYLLSKGFVESRLEGKRITFKTADLPVDSLCELIDQIVKEQANEQTS